jgi:hypothetical protein
MTFFFISFFSPSVSDLHSMKAPFNVPQFKVFPLLTFNVNDPLLYKHLEKILPQHHFVPHKSIQSTQEMNPGLHSEKLIT